MIAENLDYCYVYKNGWYRLDKNYIINLYNADQQLIAENLTDCEVFDNGCYRLD